MMSAEAKRNLISTLLLECMSGDSITQITHGGKMCGMIIDYLRTEIIDKDPDRSYLVRIYNSLFTSVTNMIEASGKTLTPEHRDKLIDLCFKGTFTIDKTWAKEQAVDGVRKIEALAVMEKCQTWFYEAETENAIALWNNPSTAINAIARRDKLLTSIVNDAMVIAMRYDLIQFTGADWKKTYEKTRMLTPAQLPSAVKTQ